MLLCCCWWGCCLWVAWECCCLGGHLKARGAPEQTPHGCTAQATLHRVFGCGAWLGGTYRTENDWQSLPRCHDATMIGIIPWHATFIQWRCCRRLHVTRKPSLSCRCATRGVQTKINQSAMPNACMHPLQQLRYTISPCYPKAESLAVGRSPTTKRIVGVTVTAMKPPAFMTERTPCQVAVHNNVLRG